VLLSRPIQEHPTPSSLDSLIQRLPAREVGQPATPFHQFDHLARRSEVQFPGQGCLQIRLKELTVPPALKQLGFINPFTGNSKAGYHAFRRFRNTHLRNRTECPEGLRKFWLGHADENMSDRYDKIKEDETFRKEWAERCGFGFKLPSVVPNVPKMEENEEAAEAA
jgi:hypothetical protein